MNGQDILLVDDDVGMISCLKDIFEDEGYNVSTAEDGKSAIEAINNKQFDLVLTDIRMPNMDGIEFLDYIEQNRPEVKVVVISAFGRDETCTKAKLLGAFEFLSKGVRVEELKKVVKKVMNRNDKT